MPKKKVERVRPGANHDGIAAREHAFIEAYLSNGNNATQAAKTAGYSEKSAHVYGCNLLKKANVAKIISERQSELASKYKLTTEDVLAELAKIVRADLRNLFDENGALLPPGQWPDEVAGSVASVEVFEEFAGRGEDRESVGFTKKLKLWDKNSALEKAMKMLGMFQKDNEQSKPEIKVETSDAELARRVAFLLRKGMKV